MLEKILRPGQDRGRVLACQARSLSIYRHAPYQNISVGEIQAPEKVNT